MSEIMREKILVYGNAGSGKSYSWLTLAQRLKDATFWVLDTDDAIPRMRAHEFDGLENLVVMPCTRWEQYGEALRRARDEAKPGDWVVVDFISSAWQAVQDYFVHEIFGVSSAEYFMRVRAELKEGTKKLETLSGWTDWVVIKKLYGEWLHTLKYELAEQHLFATSPLKLFGPETPREIRQTFAGMPGTPAGEKNLPYEFHTILYLEKPAGGEWNMTTVKDRGRVEMDGQRVKNFYLQYYRKFVEKEGNGGGGGGDKSG